MTKIRDNHTVLRLVFGVRCGYISGISLQPNCGSASFVIFKSFQVQVLTIVTGTLSGGLVEV